jgi:hypothetical protein
MLLLHKDALFHLNELVELNFVKILVYWAYFLFSCKHTFGNEYTVLLSEKSLAGQVGLNVIYQ